MLGRAKGGLLASSPCRSLKAICAANYGRVAPVPPRVMGRPDSALGIVSG